MDRSPAEFFSRFDDEEVSTSSGVFLSAAVSFVLEEVVDGGASLQDDVVVDGPSLDVDAKQGAGGGGGGDESACEEGLNAKEAPTIRPERCEVPRV